MIDNQEARIQAQQNLLSTLKAETERGRTQLTAVEAEARQTRSDMAAWKMKVVEMERDFRELGVFGKQGRSETDVESEESVEELKRKLTEARAEVEELKAELQKLKADSE